MGADSRDWVCIIGARRGSKRLPGKNRELLNGKPLYAYAVEAAVEASIFTEIIFSSDDEKILENLRSNPAVLADSRPSELSGDQVVMWDVVHYLLYTYCKRLKETKHLCLLTPCHPFRTAEHIRQAYRLYKERGATSLVSVTSFPAPPELALTMTEGKIRRGWSGPFRKGEHAKKYYPNGAIVIVCRDFFEQHRDVYSPDTVGYELGWPYCLDIDYEEDLQLARSLAEQIIPHPVPAP